MSDRRPRLIEVALPLTAINAASSREKSIRHGHPSTLHLWWSRKPLATSRAMLFAQLVLDPSAEPERFPTEADQRTERQRLFGIVEKLVEWGRRDDPEVLAAARDAIVASCPDGPPGVLDPFCGGGSIPFEAQRLGLRAHGSDLNPVAVLITRGLIEFPQRFIDQPPIIAPDPTPPGGWKGTAGLAADLREAGKRVMDAVRADLAPLYPKIGGQTPLAWLWVRTAVCPNPACRASMPLASKWRALERGGRKIWIEPVVSGAGHKVRFELRSKGEPTKGTVGRTGAVCVACGGFAPIAHLRKEASAGRMGQRMVAAMVDVDGQRDIILAEPEDQRAALCGEPDWVPDWPLQGKLQISAPLYGMETFAQLFSNRQLTALGALGDALRDLRGDLREAGLAAGKPEGLSLDEGGVGAAARADALTTYLAFALDKCADYWNTLATWMSRGTIGHAFTRQALAMAWDWAEANPLSDFHCAWPSAVSWVAEQLATAPRGVPQATAAQSDATAVDPGPGPIVISTDPPYYDNILYSDLSDFFYVWLRRALRPVFPKLFRTVLVPRGDELVATPYRFEGDKKKARDFFEEGMGRAFARMRALQHPDYPMTVYYAFKQTAKRREGGRASTGWEAMLAGLLGAGFEVCGTWPVRSERTARMAAQGANSLASSIVLVCRPKHPDAPAASRTEFRRALRRELPDAVLALQQGGVAPVDLAQAAIGPGMRLFSSFSRVIDPDGTDMSVGEALALINRALDEALGDVDEALDAETRWALSWFEAHSFEPGAFGDAETLARARNTDLRRLTKAGIARAERGQASLVDAGEIKAGASLWGLVWRLVRAVSKGGHTGAAALGGELLGREEEALALLWRIHAVCERTNRANLSRQCNALVVAWPEVVRLSQIR